MKRLLLVLMLMLMFSGIGWSQEIEVRHIMEERYIYLNTIHKFGDNAYIHEGVKYLAFPSLTEANKYLKSHSMSEIEENGYTLDVIYLHTLSGKEDSFETNVLFLEENEYDKK